MPTMSKTPATVRAAPRTMWAVPRSTCRKAESSATTNSGVVLLSGVTTTTSLSLGDVVVVTPLSNTTPLFVVALLSAFRQVERGTAHIVLGAALTVAGVLLIVGI